MIDPSTKKNQFKNMTEEAIHLLKIVKTKATREENSTTDKLMNFKTMDLLLFRKKLILKITTINLVIKESNMVIKKELVAMLIDKLKILLIGKILIFNLYIVKICLLFS